MDVTAWGFLFPDLHLDKNAVARLLAREKLEILQTLIGDPETGGKFLLDLPELFWNLLRTIFGKEHTDFPEVWPLGDELDSLVLI
ncbi:hypothetical protein IT157_10450 [bacterium]|nr:hypothetical protein [bacterium]